MATMPGKRSDRTRRPLTWLTLLLALALVLTGALAWKAIEAQREQERVAQRTLADYADFAAYNLASGIYREVGIQVLARFAALPPAGSPSLFSSPATSLGCAAGFYFEFLPNTGSLRLGSPAPDAVAAQQLADTLAHARQLFNEASWRFRYLRLELPNDGSGVFITAFSTADGFGVRGMSSCIWDDSDFTKLMRREHALPPSLTEDREPDSLYGVTVADGNGEVLYRSAEQYLDGIPGSAMLGPEFGQLAVAVSLNPATAGDLLIGGTGSSSAPSAVGLFSLSALLLLAAAAQLRREYRLIGARSGFVSRVSHELRTPLSQILIFTELLKLGRLRSDAERNRALDIIDKEVRRLIRLVENVLLFSRAAEPPKLVLEPVDLGSVARETVDAFRPLADARRATVELAISPGTAVIAERNALRQVLINLLDNAVKYGPAGQTVLIEAASHNGAVALAVEDQGPGIPQDQREEIWRGFTRLAEEEGAGPPGSGIGLAVVRSLVDMMGGKASVTDSATGGSRFAIELPSGRGAPQS